MDLTAAVRSPGYLKLLVLAALLGIPISLAALAFLALIHWAEHAVWYDIPEAVGSQTAPWWLLLAVPLLGGVLVALATRLPGHGGHRPLDGFGGGPTKGSYLPSILIAAAVSLTAGAVLGPEAPLIALGSGLAAIAGARAARSNPTASQLLALSGAFAAVSTIFGNPLAAAILLVEAIGLGGAVLTVALLPGLVSAGVGYLVYTGVGDLTGVQTPTLAVPILPPGGALTVGDIGWAVVVGIVGAVLMVAVRRAAARLDAVTSRVSPLLALPVAGLVVGACAVAFVAATGGDGRDVLFSGQTSLGPLAASGSTAALGVLTMLVVLKAVAYAVSLGSGFRGGPIFPAMFLGAALGLIAGRILPGMSPLAGFAAGMAAATAAMMRLPLASLLLVALLVGSAALQVAPVVIIAVVVATVVRAYTDASDPVALAPDSDLQKQESPAAAAAGHA